MASTALRWIARVWSVLTFGLICAFFFGGRESMRPTAMEAIGLLLFPGGILLGFALAWWREGIGGLVSIASLLLFYAWLYARDGHFRGVGFFPLVAAPAVLFVLSALLRPAASRSRAGRTPVRSWGSRFSRVRTWN